MKNCLYSKCGKEFEPTKPKQKFCCAVHKTYWHREQPKIEVKNYNKQSSGKTKNIKPIVPQNESIDTKTMSDMEELFNKLKNEQK